MLRIPAPLGALRAPPTAHKVLIPTAAFAAEELHFPWVESARGVLILTWPVLYIAFEAGLFSVLGLGEVLILLIEDFTEFFE